MTLHIYVCPNDDCSHIEVHESTGDYTCPVHPETYLVERCYTCNGTPTIEVDGKCYCESCFNDWFTKCADCGKVVPKAYAVNGLCKECFDKKYFTCKVCGEIRPIEEAYLMPNGDMICQRCHRTSVSVCSDCGKEFYSRRGGNTRHGRVCDNCVRNYFYCESCGYHEPLSEKSELSSDSFSICKTCEHLYTRCDNCGMTIQRDSIYTLRKYPGSVFCSDCYDELKPQTVKIHEYRYKPMPIFSQTMEERGHTKLFEGIELEFDGGKRSRLFNDDFDKFRQDFYIKKDGSLTDEGIEIVSHPRSLKSWIEYKKSGNLPALMEWVLQAGYTENGARREEYNEDYYDDEDRTSCGLHIHVSRNFFGETENMADVNVAKSVILMDKLWESIIFPCTRRREEDVDQWAAPNFMRVSQKDNLRKSASLIKENDNDIFRRHTRVNITNPSTVEFRVWKSTTRTDELIATLQLTDYLCRFAKGASKDSTFEVTKESFLLGCPQYPELMWYFKERGIY